MGGIWSSFVGFLEWVLLEFSVLAGSAGLGIIFFTIVARLVILPLTLTSIRSSRRMQELQPMIKELQRKHGKDQRKLQEETLKLYREYKINPAGSCLPLLLQLPIFFGVYQAVLHLMVPDQQQFLSNTVKQALEDPSVNALFTSPFLGLIDLGKATWGADGFAGPIYLVLPILSIVFQFLQQLMATPRVQDPQQKAMMQAMMFMPLVFGYIAFTFPAGAVLYWVMSSVVGVVQQYFISGWGSLANHLKFLPPDKRPTSTLAAATPSGSVSVVGSSQDDTRSPAAEAQRSNFWDVLRPLVEQESTGDQTTPSDDAVEQAIEQVRRQGRPQQNPRRQRRRR
ncbi:MAG: YidC/Oxa1 family membrane protein insertase [Chloroflexales bacterium]|nr:YidC/Oxa1 family membrane protein insertase [Chloroflexales bacterium]